MLIVVLTGGLGSGKSTAARYFSSRGAAIIDADVVAARVLRGDERVREQVIATFGPEVRAADGSVDRAALAAVAFADPASAARLNALVHPAVIREIERELRELRASATPPAVAVVEVPLLPEAPQIAPLADRVLAMSAPADTRLQRSVGRGMDADDARARIARQATDEERAVLAHDIILNDGSPADLECALAAYWELMLRLRAD